MNEKFFKSKGFSPGWLEETSTSDKQVDKKQTVMRKNLEVLLSELEQIKKDYERISEKKEKLQNLLKFYSRFVYD